MRKILNFFLPFWENRPALTAYGLFGKNGLVMGRSWGYGLGTLSKAENWPFWPKQAKKMSTQAKSIPSLLRTGPVQILTRYYSPITRPFSFFFSAVIYCWITAAGL
jgi:hypothetical protein